MCSKKEIILAYSIKIAMQKLEEGRGFGECHTIIKNLKHGAPVSMYSKGLQKSHLYLTGKLGIAIVYYTAYTFTFVAAGGYT